MPNWATNELEVEGPKKDVSRFNKRAWTEGKCLSERRFIPYPKRFADKDAAYKEWATKNPNKACPFKDGFNSGGYEWCIAKWGTKWGFVGPTVTGTLGGGLIYNFTSAWSPPIPLIEKMHEMFPSLTFTLKYQLEEEGSEISHTEQWAPAEEEANA